MKMRFKIISAIRPKTNTNDSTVLKKIITKIQSY